MANRTLLQWFSQSGVCASFPCGFVDFNCPLVSLDHKDTGAGYWGSDLRAAGGTGRCHCGCVRPKARSTWGRFAHSRSITLVHRRWHPAVEVQGEAMLERLTRKSSATAGGSELSHVL